MTSANWPVLSFRDFLIPNKRPYQLGESEDANLVGMRLYGEGPFHRELKTASNILKKSHFVIREKDVIYNKLFAWKGTFGIVPRELDGMFVSDKFPTYQLDESKVHPDYLSLYFKKPSLWLQAQDMSTGSAALSKLTLNPPRFLDLRIPAPDIDEQIRISRKVSILRHRLDEAKMQRVEADRICSSFYRSLLRQLSDKFDCCGTLDRVFKSKPRNGWSAKCDNRDDGVSVLSLSAVTGFEYRAEAVKRTSLQTDPSSHYWLNSGDLLITRSNTPELVGHAAIYSGYPTPCIYPDLMMRLDIDESLATKEFVWFWLQTPLVRSYISQKAKGTSPTMKKISQPIVNAIPFPAKIDIEEQNSLLSVLRTGRANQRLLLDQCKSSGIAISAVMPSVIEHAFEGLL